MLQDISLLAATNSSGVYELISIKTCCNQET